MRRPHVDDVVTLTRDVPNLSLHRGDRGVVRSLWFSPIAAVEVEFSQIGNDYQTRAVLMEEQVEVACPEPVEGATPEPAAGDEGINPNAV